jgi:hypothetical protein
MLFLAVPALAREERLQEDKPCVTEIGEIPWIPDTGEKVVYGEDDRRDVYMEEDATRLEWAASTCALIYTTRLTLFADGSAQISAPAAYTRSGLPACDDEPFKNQPTASYCTGFMVGEDLIVTAGHCFSTSYIDTVRFIFGYDMIDDRIPQLEFDAKRVYKGVEVLSYIGTSNKDHCVVRVDRPITAPGARPFPIRREGSVQIGTPLGIIGHPAGLPKKIAFGDTFVRSTPYPEYFVANLDAFSGNSGSPVINAETGYVEGILVRGDTDFQYEEDCFRSYKVPNDGGRGEEVTRTSIFANYVPDIESYPGSLRLNMRVYSCDSTLSISLIDRDLREESFTSVTVETLSGDREIVILNQEADEKDRFTGSIEVRSGEPSVDSGSVEVVHGDLIVVRYVDEENAHGEVEIVEIEAPVDCIPPTIDSVKIPFVGAAQARIEFETDEACTGVVYYGLSCDKLDKVAQGSAGQTSHTVILTGLARERVYYFSVEALDNALNAGSDNNNGLCYRFQTTDKAQIFTEYFHTQNQTDIRYGQITFLPSMAPDYYQACYETVTDFPVVPSGEELTLGDDDFVRVDMDPGLSFAFYGTSHDHFFVGSNGYVTFEKGDTNFQALPSQHFLASRISAFMCDLNPEAKGTIRVARLSDRYCVSFEDVPLYSGSGAYGPDNRHDFMIELYYSGMIRITWKELSAPRALVGLSTGLGTPTGFTSMKLKNQQACEKLGFEGDPHSADSNGDWLISREELWRVISYYQQGYHCDSASIDGFAPGEGPRDCSPHDSDFMEQDWKISLSELLRLIQLHNARGYQPDPLSEDGFAPLP